jgi:predicted acylesterase/phospholipase RssA
MPIEPAKAAITRDPVLVDLALQGRGSHGAFTWGVLDRLLDKASRREGLPITSQVRLRSCIAIVR